MGLFLFGCSKPMERVVLPHGIQEVSGYLIPTELSLVRRGTHLLLQEGVQKYLVESKLTALRSFEGKEVMIRGFFENNIDSSHLPVLVVQEIREQEEAWKKIDIDVLGLTFDFPPQWVVAKSQHHVFLSPESTLKPSIVRIVWDETTPASEGEPVRVGGRMGLRILHEESGEQKIIVPQDRYFVSFEFTPHTPDHLLEERAIFLRLLRSVQWSTSARMSQSSSSKDYGAPCGGTAGILCPLGFYCEIADFKEGIGRCVQL